MKAFWKLAYNSVSVMKWNYDVTVADDIDWLTDLTEMTTMPKANDWLSNLCVKENVW